MYSANDIVSELAMEADNGLVTDEAQVLKHLDQIVGGHVLVQMFAPGICVV